MRSSDPTARLVCRAALALVLMLGGGQAFATIPVIDAAALVQLRSQVEAWRSQLTGMAQQLQQLQQSYTAMTGQRGLQNLLPIAAGARNYLPQSWPDPAGAITGWGALAATVQAEQVRNTVLTAGELARFSGAIQSLVAGTRREIAASDVATHTAYQTASGRFVTLQSLIDRIGATPDAKAIAELQGRIAAEQAMLANEALKLTALTQVTASQAAVQVQQQRELVVAGHGAFASRFQPSPPAP